MRRSPALQVVPAGVAALVAALVITLLVWPNHVDGSVNWVAARVPIPGFSERQVWWLFEDLGNVALFAPVGFALAVVLRRPVPAVLGGVLLSAACEIAQHWIPPRVPSLLDFAMNTIGTIAGAAVGAWFLHRMAGPSHTDAGRARRSEPDQASRTWPQSAQAQ